MILSMYKLDRNDFSSLKITDLYSIHRIVYDLFPKKEGIPREFLFADKGGDWRQRRILILSKESPQIPEYGVLESKKIPETFLQFQNYGFEVVLNPTTREGATKKVLPVKGKENLNAWFKRKAEDAGFCIDEQKFEISKTGVVVFNKDNAECTFNTATFKGTLQVVDKQKFTHSFENGIGRGKGFGFGLLQLVPIN